MESPVRICLGAAIVVNLLLLTTTLVNSSALPYETNPTTVNDEKNTKHNRLNNTWTTNSRPRTLDVALNELHPKESNSEEHSEKNAKYKDRGRVKFFSQIKSSTQSPLRRIKSTESVNVIVVTPTAEVKKPSQIIDSMQTYKKFKMTAAASSSTLTPVSLKTEYDSQEVGDEDDEEEEDSYDKYTSSKFHDSSFFTMPGYSDDSNFNTKRKKYSKTNDDFNTPSFDKFSSYFSKDTFDSKENINDEPYKSDSFFDFDSDLTTPKNDFFDQKFRDISSSIVKNLDSMKTKSPPINVNNSGKIVKENVGFEKLTSGTPHNKSTVIIKNTKEIRLVDNDQAGSSNQGLSDIHGTSIYYEMSVLSTETYNINHTSDDDCENDTSAIEATVSTSLKEEDASLKATQPTLVQVSTRSVLPDSLSDVLSSAPPTIFASTIPNTFNAITPIEDSATPVSRQNIVQTEGPLNVFSTSFTRNRNYSKRINLTESNESPNSITSQSDQVSNFGMRPITRKFYYTTPKVKPIWMAPSRSVVKSYKSTYPTTIYAEHFNIKDKFTKTNPSMPSQRTVLTTLPSDIDPVLQSDVSGIKKIVHSQIISDNTIPTLGKRGSMKFVTSSEPSIDVGSGVSDLEIPPTMTAWALASLRSPPALTSPILNVTSSTQRSVDENELQKVSEVLDKIELTTVSTTTTTVGVLSNDIISKNITDIDQNKIPWKPILSEDEVNKEDQAVTKSERLPAESNISVQNSIKPSETILTTQTIKTSPSPNKDETKSPWVPAMVDTDVATTEESKEILENTIQPVDAAMSTGFESITKLPSSVTKPTDEIVVDAENNETTTEQEVKAKGTTGYDVTTIRFSYVSTEESTETETVSTDEEWLPVNPTRTLLKTIKDVPVTTYRPKYTITTQMVDEETTILPIETTPTLEVSSQLIANATQKTTQTIEDTTMEQLTTKHPITTEATTTEPTTGCDDTEGSEATSDTTVETELTTQEFKETTEIPSTSDSLKTVSTEMPFDRSSEDNSNSNEVISQDTTELPSFVSTPSASTSITSTSITVNVNTITTAATTTSTTTTTTEMTTQSETTTVPTTTESNAPLFPATERTQEQTTQPNAQIIDTTVDKDTTVYTTTEPTTKSVNELEDLTSYAEEITTESSRILAEEASSGAAIAIAVSTIGVIALVLLVGLLLVVRRRGRRGVYAQRCTPVSLDAYSLDSVSVGHRKGNHRLRASKRSYGNPAYDDEVTSHPMAYAALANFALDVDSMSTEFAEIPSVSVRPDEVPPGCEDKNRYSNVLPLPETRVPLRRIGNDLTTEYINANFITGPGNIRNYYILCQAPLANTVVDFWRMIWEQNSRVIVMLTEYMENGVEKCYEYMPPSEVSDNRRTFGEYQIILKKREQRDKYAISSVQLINLATRTWREVTHLWYFWPAKGVPDDYDSIIDFLSEMRSYMKISQTAKEYDEEGVEVIYGDQSRSSYNNLAKLRSDDNSSGNGMNVYSPAKAEDQMRRNNVTNGTLGRMKAASEVEGVRPCTVVCASGAGRSAALVALDVSARALAAGAADVPRAVRELRAQRPHSLANRHHYIFIYKVLSEYGNKLMGGGVDTI